MKAFGPFLFGMLSKAETRENKLLYFGHLRSGKEPLLLYLIINR